jgi:AcrR family transcriptional regulator
VSIGLRERKKLKTRAAIQKEAMRLFLKKGFEATTIEEIAEAVEISPSTFFNYFPSKEDVVLQDDLDPLLYAAFASQPPDVNPLAALRTAMRSVFSHLTPDQDSVLKNRLRLLATSPVLRAAMLDQFAGMVQQGAELLASRLGRSPDDFAVRNLSGALMGVMIATFMAAANDPNVDLLKLADEAMAHLEAGLPLDWTQES